MAWNPSLEWTGGGLVSNPADLVRWGRALFEGSAIKGNYLDDLLESVPIHKDNPETRYGIAVAIRRDGPFGPSYGHGGWIPGYCSSLRYYPDADVAVAFQVNTDIGIVDTNVPVTEQMESRLADIAVTAVSR
jgi:D-alanyl-D-alanine carboxypeptidase